MGFIGFVGPFGVVGFVEYRIAWHIVPPAIVPPLSSTGYYSTLISAIFDKYPGIN